MENLTNIDLALLINELSEKGIETDPDQDGVYNAFDFQHETESFLLTFDLFSLETGDSFDQTLDSPSEYTTTHFALVIENLVVIKDEDPLILSDLQKIDIFISIKKVIEEGLSW